VIALRQQALPFANHWYTGLPDALGLHDLAWMEPDGTPAAGRGLAQSVGDAVRWPA
jgi:hypothetical protein